MREKRQREVQFLKAGIKFPHSYQPFKKRAVDHSAHEVEDYTDKVQVQSYELTQEKIEVLNNSSISSLSSEELSVRHDVGSFSGMAGEADILVKQESSDNMELPWRDSLVKSLSTSSCDDENIRKFKVILLALLV